MAVLSSRRCCLQCHNNAKLIDRGWDGKPGVGRANCNSREFWIYMKKRLNPPRSLNKSLEGILGRKFVEDFHRLAKDAGVYRDRPGRLSPVVGEQRMAEVTELLSSANRGDASASHRLFELTYRELKRLAHSSLKGRSGSADINTTTLVHESFLRLAGREGYTPADKHAFYAYVGSVMRSVVIDEVRARQARKRGGNQIFVTLTTGVEAQAVEGTQLLAIDDALNALAKLAPDLKNLVEMRYFAGLTVQEIAEVLGKPLRSVEREWQKARMLLLRLIEEG